MRRRRYAGCLAAKPAKASGVTRAAASAHIFPRGCCGRGAGLPPPRRLQPYICCP
jgi:hypothetical protein